MKDGPQAAIKPLKTFRLKGAVVLFNLFLDSSMPEVNAQGKTFTCPRGANLRRVLLENGVALHNGQSKVVNCRGLGTCGTCAVEVDGAVSEANWRDLTRRSLPPHSPTRNLRLACQTQVLGTVSVTKYEGFWGQGAAPVWTAKGA